MKNQIVLIGDVIQSRKQFNPETWSQFHELINRINQEYNSELTIPMTIYSGDSFGGICKTMEAAIAIILSIQEYQTNQKTRIVLIEDEITYGLEQRDFLTLEGPALWKSQELMNQLKKKSSFFRASLQNEIKTLTLNTILNLILTIRDEWKDLEWNIYKNEEKNLTQQELATQLGVTQQYISKTIKKSKLQLIKDVIQNLKLIINGIDNHNYSVK